MRSLFLAFILFITQFNVYAEIEQASLTQEQINQKLTQLYSENSNWMIKQAQGYANINKAQAEDLVQDVFERIHKRLNRGGISDIHRGYLYVTLRSLLNDYYTKMNRQLSVIDYLLGSELWRVEASSTEVLELQRYLAMLKRHHPKAHAFLIVYAQSGSLKETAEKMGISVRTAQRNKEKVIEYFQSDVDLNLKNYRDSIRKRSIMKTTVISVEGSVKKGMRR